ncbi:MAG: cupin-like domain-containing protein [Leptolyngbya sp. SIO1D8]|nr:cupin-like domain-containing protein [Leptolyngbya sp. SIO1D8]
MMFNSEKSQTIVSRKKDNTPVWTKISSVDRRSNLSYQEFVEEYASVGKPVIMTGVTNSWEAAKKWNYNFFKEQYGSRKCSVRNCQEKHLVYMTVSDYMDYMISDDRSEILYMAGNSLWNYPELLKDYEIPVYFPDWMDKFPRKFTRTLLQATKPMRWLFIGPKGASSGKLHYEMWHSSGWVGMISGRKRFVFFAPDQTDFLYGGKVDIFSPDLDRFPLYASAEPVEAIVEAGDVIYAPPLWWHQVENLEDSISVTHDFINESNSEQVFQYFRNNLPVVGNVIPFIFKLYA